MEWGNDPLTIPFGIGLGRSGNAVIRFGWSLALAGLGFLLYGFDSTGVLLLAGPMIVGFAFACDQILAQLQCTRLVGARSCSLYAFAIGPFLVITRPFRVRMSLHVPNEYFSGHVIPRFPVEAPGDAMIRAAAAMLRRNSTVVMFAALAATLFGTIVGSPVVLLGIFGALTFVFGVRIVQMRNLAVLIPPPDGEAERLRAQAIHQAMMLSQHGRIHELSLDTIRDMTALHDCSYDEMVGQLLAFYARTAQGEAYLAALHVRRAVAAADLVRRKPLPAMLQTLSIVYHEAAFVAAAYAGDVDFALRAMAVGSEAYLDRTAFHKAMTAIWIRRGDRSEAARSLRKAEKDLRYCLEDGPPAYHERHLAEMRAVFAGHDLRPLSKPEIGTEFFVGSHRPTFFMSSHDTLSLKVIYFSATALLVPTSVLASLILDSGLGFMNVCGVVLALTACVMFALCKSYAHQRLYDSTIEPSGTGILHRYGFARRWLPWESVERTGRISGGFFSRPGLIVSRDAYSRAGGMRFEPAFIPTTNYSRGWPDGNVDVELRRLAPHLFIGAADGSEVAKPV
jgi:hypothetical protein